MLMSEGPTQLRAARFLSRFSTFLQLPSQKTRVLLFDTFSTPLLLFTCLIAGRHGLDGTYRSPQCRAKTKQLAIAASLRQSIVLEA
jgi:hypothetical protein